MSMYSFSNYNVTNSRRQLALLLFAGNAVLYAMRVNLSVAIVAMVGVREKKNNTVLPAFLRDTCPKLESPVIAQVSKLECQHISFELFSRVSLFRSEPIDVQL